MTFSLLPAVDPHEDRIFRDLLHAAGLDGDPRFGASYVEWEWARARHLFDTLPRSLARARALEVGCHLGATAIVLALLGAEVVAVDVDPLLLALSRANARRYGVAGRIRFVQIARRGGLPFAAASFDVVSCNSVLEYVAADHLPVLQREIGRVLRPRGLAVVQGTSSRLWPREKHSRQWLSNYVPKALDRFVPGARLRRGLTPWRIRAGFPGYVDLLADGGRLLGWKTRAGLSRGRLRFLALACRLLRRFDISAGTLLPAIAMVLRKP